MPRRSNNNNPNALSDSETAFANADDALTAAADATQTDANNGDPPTTTTIATQPRQPSRAQLRHTSRATQYNQQRQHREQHIADAVTNGNGLTRQEAEDLEDEDHG